MVDKKSCAHNSLEFELGGKLLRCRNCGQEYHAIDRTGSTKFPTINFAYYNIHILHQDRREKIFRSDTSVGTHRG